MNLAVTLVGLLLCSLSLRRSTCYYITEVAETGFVEKLAFTEEVLGDESSKFKVVLFALINELSLTLDQEVNSVGVSRETISIRLVVLKYCGSVFKYIASEIPLTQKFILKFLLLIGFNLQLC